MTSAAIFMLRSETFQATLVLISSQYVNDDESSNLELIIYYITQLNKFWPWFGSLVFICSGQVDDIILLKSIEFW